MTPLPEGMTNPKRPVDKILRERGKTHGQVGEQFKLAQELKQSIRRHTSNGIPEVAQEALDMICTKISRIASGNALVLDHWKDIAGYSTLIADEIENALEEEDEF